MLIAIAPAKIGSFARGVQKMTAPGQLTLKLGGMTLLCSNRQITSARPPGGVTARAGLSSRAMGQCDLKNRGNVSKASPCDFCATGSTKLNPVSSLLPNKLKAR
jgi:hypothetical protein